MINFETSMNIESETDIKKEIKYITEESLYILINNNDPIKEAKIEPTKKKIIKRKNHD